MTFLGAAAPLESQIRGQLVEIVRNYQSELFRSYQQSGHHLQNISFTSELPSFGSQPIGTCDQLDTTGGFRFDDFPSGNTL